MSDVLAGNVTVDFTSVEVMPIVATVALLNQTSAVSTTTLFTPAADGSDALHGYLAGFMTGGGGAAGVSVTVSYTNAYTGADDFIVTISGLGSGDKSFSNAVYLTSGTNLTYATSMSGSATYVLGITVLKMQ